MSAEVRGLLVSDHKSWMLDFEAPPPPKNTTPVTIAVKALAVLTSLVVWPLLFLSGSLVFTISSFDYLKSVWNQHKIVAAFANENNLREFAAKRAESCERQIKNLKAEALYLMEHGLKNPDELHLSIPSKKTFLDRFASRLPDEYWNDFSWDAFLAADFLEKSNIPENPDKRSLLELEELRMKIVILKQQKDLFLQGNTELEKIQAVAQMSFVKNGIRRQRSKEQMMHSVLWLFPLGIVLDAYLTRSHNDRLTYENNKSFLPLEVGLDSHKDLIEAHNQLLTANPFLVPYIVRGKV